MKSILENLRRLSLLAFAVIAVFISYTLFPPAASATLYVGNLSFQANEKDLRQVFSEYGQVARISLPTDRETGRLRGFANVEMSSETEEDADIEALDGAEWMERELRVSKAKPRDRDGGAGGVGVRRS